MGINGDQKIVACFQQAAELNELHLLYELTVWGWSLGWGWELLVMGWTASLRSAASVAGDAPGA